MKLPALIVFALLATPAAFAQPAPQKPDAGIQALGQMLNEAVAREAQATVRAIAAEREVAVLRDEVKTLTPAPKPTEPAAK